MKAGGLDLVDVSMGFNTPDVSKVPWGEHAFLAPIAARIKQEVGIPVTSSWNFSDAAKINELIQNGSIDLVNLGKTLLSDPNWPYHAAQTLGRDRPQDVLAIQYGHWLKQRGEKKTGRHD
jgi:2,4-dienoyl-CoA reductase-like NADH-dependent reductase (Old Yellow Enzyme family)